MPGRLYRCKNVNTSRVDDEVEARTLEVLHMGGVGRQSAEETPAQPRRLAL